MLIREIEIQNFKCIKSLHETDLTPIVGIWGKNGTGKSTILQALVVLKNAAQGGNLLNSNGISLGNLTNVIYMHDLTLTCNLRLKLEDGKEMAIALGASSTTLSRYKIPPDKLRYFPPWRRVASRSSSVSSLVMHDFGIQGSTLHNFIHWFSHRKLLEKDRTGKPNERDKINEWARKLGYGEIFDKQIADNQVMATYIDPVFGLEVPVVDGGYGGNAFLPILFEAYSFTNGVLLIEEPEISLHPGAQSDILDFFIEMANERKHQIIFTSHSEYLLKKIARYTMEGKIDDSLVTVFVADKNKSTGTTLERKDLKVLADLLSKNREILPELTMR